MALSISDRSALSLALISSLSRNKTSADEVVSDHQFQKRSKCSNSGALGPD